MIDIHLDLGQIDLRAWLLILIPIYLLVGIMSARILIKPTYFNKDEDPELVIVRASVTGLWPVLWAVLVVYKTCSLILGSTPQGRD